MRTLTLLLTLLLTAPLAAAQTTTDVQQYAADFEDVRANHTIRSNGSVPYQIGNVSHYLVGNITNQSLSQNRTWTLPDLTGTVALSDSAGNIQWAAVSKSGSSLADLATRAISDTTGDLPWARVDKTGSSLADLATRAIGDTTGTLATTRGGTGLTSYATGDIIYASAADTLAKLPAGTNGHVLTLTGGVPTWQAGGGSDCTTDCTFTGTVTANRLVATHDTSGAHGFFPLSTVNTTLTLNGAGALASSTVLTWAGDTNLYRQAANELMTDDALKVGGYAFIGQGTANRVQIANGIAGIVLGSADDTNLYRNAANELKTDDLFTAGGGLTVAATTAFKLPVQSSATMPSVGQGVCAYDSTNHRVQCGMGSSPSYKTLANLADAQTWAAGQTFSASNTYSDGANLILGTSTGTQIGTASTQKIGFLGATPIARKTLTDNTGGNGGTTCNVIGGVTYTTDAPAIRDCQTRILAVLREFGFIN